MNQTINQWSISFSDSSHTHFWKHESNLKKDEKLWIMERIGIETQYFL